MESKSGFFLEGRGGGEGEGGRGICAETKQFATLEGVGVRRVSAA